MVGHADQQERLEGTDPGRRRAAGIYGSVVTAAVIAAVQDQLPTRALVVAVLVTLLVYWIAAVRRIWPAARC